MTTKLEQLKSKLDKRASEIEELKKSIETEELAELQAEEFAGKSADILSAIANFAKGEFDKAGLVMPSGKSVTLTAADGGVWTGSMLAPKASKKSTGEHKAGTNGKKGALECPKYPNEKLTWHQIADKEGISVGAGSAHKAVFTANKALHDTVVHTDCPYV